MRIKLFIRIIGLTTILLFITSCQKDDNSENSKEADICPEVAMKNYEEAGMIINDFLNHNSGNTESENLEQLDNYFNKCDCVQSVVKTSDKISSYPGIREVHIRFVFNSDTVNKTMDIMVFGDGRLEFRKFQQ